MVGTAVGGLLGLASDRLPSLVVVGWAGLAFLAVALLVELSGRPLPLVHHDKETPRSWIEDGWLGWAVKNGTALALGFTTRLGFPVWYAIPCIALLASDPVAGAMTWGTYGAARNGLSVLAGVWLPGSAVLRSPGYAEWILDLRYRARLGSSAAGAITCLLVAIAAA